MLRSVRGSSLMPHLRVRRPLPLRPRAGQRAADPDPDGSMHAKRSPALAALYTELRSAASAVGTADCTRVVDRAHPLGHRITRQNDGRRDPDCSTERHLGSARGRQQARRRAARATPRTGLWGQVLGQHHLPYLAVADEGSDAVKRRPAKGSISFAHFRRSALSTHSSGP
jgi:hypothetical protein